jgi:hypothetical protein
MERTTLMNCSNTNCESICIWYKASEGKKDTDFVVQSIPAQCVLLQASAPVPMPRGKPPLVWDLHKIHSPVNTNILLSLQRWNMHTTIRFKTRNSINNFPYTAAAIWEIGMELWQWINREPHKLIVLYPILLACQASLEKDRKMEGFHHNRGSSRSHHPSSATFF